MRVDVETHVDDDGNEKLLRIFFDDRLVEATDTIDRWHGDNYRYLKVRDSEGNLYILRHNEIQNAWELTMFQRAYAKGVPVSAEPASAGQARTKANSL
ncbi:MAG: hypothetical protein ACK4UO_08305 [Pseudolabrys sp.]